MKATCGGCDNTWAGETRRAHCSVCHLTFANVKLFDAHIWRYGRYRRHKTGEEMGLVEHDGTWYDVQNDDQAAQDT